MFVRVGSVVSLAAFCVTAVKNQQHPLSRHVEVMNDSGHKIMIHWINPKTGERVRFTEPYLSAGDKVALNSFVNHSFIIEELDTNETTCSSSNSGNSCHPLLQMTIRDNEEQVVVIKEGLELEYIEDDYAIEAPTEAEQIMESCRSYADRALAMGQNPNQVMESLMNCMEDEASEAFQRKNEEKAYHQQLRLQLSSQLEPFTCLGNQETTMPDEYREWVDPEGTLRQVGILHERAASQIHVIPDFITAEECQAITDEAQPILHRGTVADGKGGSKLSEHRKAWQAAIPFGWNDPESLIAQVGRRVYAYTNHATGYNLTTDGQEDLMSIQYFGQGADSKEPPDQYKPHCDGECAGLPSKRGARVATMVMYCNVPKVGGGTNFQNSNVYVKPTLHAAAFFSYMDPLRREMETGFTSHSGCPVIEGTKRIAVHWMRVGVDDDNPWDSFNTLTIQKSAIADCD